MVGQSRVYYLVVLWVCDLLATLESKMVENFDMMLEIMMENYLEQDLAYY